MAGGCVSTSSVIKSSKNYFLECDLDEILRYKDAKCFAYHGNRIKWTDSFEMLKLFIKCAIEQAGTWMSSGGKYKKFTSSSSDLILTWNYGLCTLSFRGEEGARLKELLIHVCTMEKNLPVSQLIWTPVDLDPRSISTSRYGPPGPNLLADMDPRGSKSTSKYGPPLADLDPPSKVKYM